VSEIYYRRQIRTVPLGGGEVLLELPDSRGLWSAASAVLELLERCPEGGTLEEHTSAMLLAANLPSERAADVRTALAELIEQGLFITKRAVVARLASTAQRQEPQPIRTIATLTRNRPRAVERCVRSYLSHVREHGRDVQFKVVDSSLPEPRCEVELRLAQVARVSGVRIGYAAIEEKMAFAAALADETGVDADVVRFALVDAERVGSDTGANRNALLMAGAGEAFVSVDDDTLCELVRPRAAQLDRLVLSSQRDPTHVRLLENEADARAAVSPLHGCLLDLHERILGRTVADCAAQTDASRFELSGLPAEALERLLTRRPSVVASFTGILGDSGAGSPAFHLWRSDVRHQLHDGAAYDALSRSRQVLHAAPATTIGSGSFLMTTSYALDARQLTPPFFPVLRGEDQLFGLVLRRCFPDHLLGHLPVCITHSPIGGRTEMAAQAWGRRRSVSMLNVLVGSLGLASVHCGASGAERLRLLGRQWTELGRMPWADFEALLRARLWRDTRREQERFESSLARTGGTHNAWAADLRRYMSDFAQVLAHEDAIVPEALRETRSIEDARLLLQRLISRYGELLVAWPELVAGSRRLRARGVSLLRAL
jgi:hypothetical protein